MFLIKWPLTILLDVFNVCVLFFCAAAGCLFIVRGPEASFTLESQGKRFLFHSLSQFLLTAEFVSSPKCHRQCECCFKRLQKLVVCNSGLKAADLFGG